jgi:hypothetical protein
MCRTSYKYFSKFVSKRTRPRRAPRTMTMALFGKILNIRFGIDHGKENMNGVASVSAASLPPSRCNADASRRDFSSPDFSIFCFIICVPTPGYQYLVIVGFAVPPHPSRHEQVAELDGGCTRYQPPTPNETSKITLFSGFSSAFDYIPSSSECTKSTQNPSSRILNVWPDYQGASPSSLRAILPLTFV